MNYTRISGIGGEPVFVMFELDDWRTDDPQYLAVIEQALAAAWDNSDDDVFNDM